MMEDRISKLSLTEKLEYVRSAWNLFAAEFPFNAEDQGAVAIITEALQNGTMERNDDLFDTHRLGNIALFVYSFLRDHAAGKRRSTTEAAGGLLSELVSLSTRPVPGLDRKLMAL